MERNLAVNDVLKKMHEDHKARRARMKSAALLIKPVKPPRPLINENNHVVCWINHMRGIEENPSQIIKRQTALKYGVSLEDINSESHKRIHVLPRREAMWRCRNECGLSFNQIAKIFKRDHTTVIHAVRAYQKHLDAGAK